LTVSTKLKSVFDSFDKAKERWEQYLERLNQHLELHNVTDQAKKRAFLLSCLDPETYNLLKNLFGEVNVSDQTFDNVVQKLSTHFTSSVHVQAARYSFYNCTMMPGQSYADWVANLRGIARNCEFRCKSNACNHLSFVDDQIRDVIIQNTPHADVRRQCLIDPEASLNDVLRKAQLYVRTLKTDQLLSGGSNSQPVAVNKYHLRTKKFYVHDELQNFNHVQAKL